MISFVHPALIMMLGALLIPFLRGKTKALYMVILPVISLNNLLFIGDGSYFEVRFLDLPLTLLYMDKMSFVFGLIFHIITIAGAIYSLQNKDNVQHVFAFFYAGAVQGVIFAGDMLSLFLFWETLTVTAAVIIWCNRTKEARGAGFRYILVHAAGGLCLLLGIVLRVQTTGDLSFGEIGLFPEGHDLYLSSVLIFIGFGVNAAWPFLHAWVVDAYPAASPTGTIFLAAFTTKSAVYVLARAFPGTEALILIGAVMAVFTLFYAVIENNLRRILAYALINQVGFMMVAIGIGTPMALSGATAHAFSHILYKGLLFMSIGAVIHVTGKTKATDLGGLYHAMPWTFAFCCIGALAMSAPLTCGFVSKSLIVSAAAYAEKPVIWAILLFSSSGVFLVAGLKVIYFAFFGKKETSPLPQGEAPLNMRLAMAFIAFFCIAVGVFPDKLYNLLPYDVSDYHLYTGAHVVLQLQLLLFTGLAFMLFIRFKLYPAPINAINLDVDVFYRKAGRFFAWSMDKILNGLNNSFNQLIHIGAAKTAARFFANAPMHLALTLPISKDNKILLKKRFKAETSAIGLSIAMATLFLTAFIVLFIKITNT